MRNRLGTGNDQSHHCTIANNEKLQMALSERERFLKHRPHMRAYQAQIDSILDKSGDQQSRLAVLGTLMQGKLLEMRKELHKLNQIIQQSVTFY
ncbi:MAG: hypothetical protein PVG51_09085 [Desulfosarcina sp.]|jgi:hypothetical protein